MSWLSSKNMTFLIALFIVATFVFAYVLISNNVDETVYTDIRQVEIDEEEE